jgi:hypothetical protein
MASFILDPVLGWPPCPECGKTMDTDFENCKPGVFAAICAVDKTRLRYRSCARAHRQCSWYLLGTETTEALRA